MSAQKCSYSEALVSDDLIFRKDHLEIETKTRDGDRPKTVASLGNIQLAFLALPALDLQSNIFFGFNLEVLQLLQTKK